MDNESTADTDSPFNVLQTRVAEVHWRWKNWKQLFMPGCTSEEAASDHTALLETTAKDFFKLIDEVLLQDVALRLCKLMDPQEGGPPNDRRKNLSLFAAIKEAKQRCGATCVDEVVKLAKQMKSASEPLLTWRNRVFAHDDNKVAIGEDEPSILTIGHIEEALSKAIEIVNLLDPEYGKVRFGYEHMAAIGDASDLITAIRYAKKCRQEWLDQFQEGTNCGSDS